MTDTWRAAWQRQPPSSPKRAAGLLGSFDLDGAAFFKHVGAVIVA
jgi:hypothetical protein